MRRTSSRRLAGRSEGEELVSLCFFQSKHISRADCMLQVPLEMLRYSFSEWPVANSRSSKQPLSKSFLYFSKTSPRKQCSSFFESHIDSKLGVRSFIFDGEALKIYQKRIPDLQIFRALDSKSWKAITDTIPIEYIWEGFGNDRAYIVILNCVHGLLST